VPTSKSSLLVSVADEGILREIARGVGMVRAFPLESVRDARLARALQASEAFARLARYYRFPDPSDDAVARLMDARDRGAGVFGVLRAIDHRPDALGLGRRPIEVADRFEPLHLRSRGEEGLGVRPAWEVSGSLGEHVSICDAEWAWLPAHED
jgi:hypothetical protein